MPSLENPVVIAALIAAFAGVLNAALGIILLRRSEKIKLTSSAELEKVRLILASFSQNLNIRKQELVKLGNSIDLAFSAAARLAEQAVHAAEPSALIGQTANSLLDISTFMTTTTSTTTTLYLKPEERALCDELVRGLTELVLSLDFDGARQRPQEYSLILRNRLAAVRDARDRFHNLIRPSFELQFEEAA